MLTKSVQYLLVSIVTTKKLDVRATLSLSPLLVSFSLSVCPVLFAMGEFHYTSSIDVTYHSGKSLAIKSSQIVPHSLSVFLFQL